MRVRVPLALAAAVASAVLLSVPTLVSAREPAERAQTTPTQAERLGLQTVPKDIAAARTAKSGVTSPQHGVNPFVAMPPDVSKSDYAYWKAAMARQSKARAAKPSAARQAAVAAAEPLLVDEREPDQIRGGNDTPATAEFIKPFGTGRNERPAARILGTLATPPTATRIGPFAEDNGAIPLANETTLTASGQSRVTDATIGDGPHGSAASGSGDFDFYAVRAARAGQRLAVSVDTPTSTLDPIALVYDSAGNILALNDDRAPGNLDSLLRFTIPADGDYFVAVVGFASLPTDPFDSGSGEGADSEGAYTATFGLDTDDVDFYSVELDAGDVLGSSIVGSGTQLSLVDDRGREVIGSTQDASFIYPAASPLPGGGNAVLAHVAAKKGRYFLGITGGIGNYDATLEVYRPGLERQGGRPTQTIFLDFDGARVNTSIFGPPGGVKTLSPFSAFIGRWGLTAADEDALIDKIVATVTENLKRDLSGAAVRVLNSRDHADPFGQPNVSRVIVGGTIEESGIATIGIAQSIDPGNFESADTALVLLDVLSGDPGDDASLNFYLRPQSNRVGFVGQAVGNVVSHEAGHYLGSFHVDQFNDVLNLMDQGGNFPLLYGVGPDGVGGTADDPDVDFGEDIYNPNEGFTGIEDTKANTRFGLSNRR